MQKNVIFCNKKAKGLAKLRGGCGGVCGGYLGNDQKKEFFFWEGFPLISFASMAKLFFIHPGVLW